jgi:hypothetical protein
LQTAAANITRMVAKSIAKSLCGGDPGLRMRWIVFSNYLLPERGSGR